MADAPLDRIHIRDLLVRCILGVYPDERREKQDVIVNITLYADLRKACLSDDIEDTVDYKTIKKRTLKMVQQSEYFLVERLAERIAELALESPVVQRVDVAVDKPGALRFARSVAVEITRAREA
ncbi:MAG TPA: dihydroneopterin aldolase [Gammaproteobacteria bacterium]|jgi:FolB domain-containing protein|nr:dihydroneopterin aldolase [Candidatus Hydrogenedentota bacterium]HJP35025.1 dihydroneopterin aldolase [Gammaproteobacteria bacterium]